ncbi:MAG: hypothetical protein CSA63_00065 [Propionibacterium sp.]|nr:MAG: hypothetical protein CSA63_00065 [Propionibacterium sp.]
MTDKETAQLIAQLTARLAELESDVARLKETQRIPEDHLVAIAAAVAAFLGHKAKIKAVRFPRRRVWVAETRLQGHNRQVLHVR